MAEPEMLDQVARVVDESMWPILVVRPPATYSPKMHKEYLALLGSIHETRKEPYCLIIDARGAPRPDSSQRRIENNFRKKYEDHVKTHCRGTALVLTSKVMVGVIQAMAWIRRPDTEVRSFSDFEPALEWARNKLALPDPG